MLHGSLGCEPQCLSDSITLKPCWEPSTELSRAPLPKQPLQTTAVFSSYSIK